MADIERDRRSGAPQKESLLREFGRTIRTSSREAVKSYFKPLTTIYEYVKGKRGKHPSPPQQ
jgi:hypothetical protein